MQALRPTSTRSSALATDERTAMRKHFAALAERRSLSSATLLMLPVADAVAVVRRPGRRIRRPRTGEAPAQTYRRPTPPIQAPIAAGEASPDRAMSMPCASGSGVGASAGAHDVSARSAMPATAVAPDPSAAAIVVPSAAPSSAPATVERNAHTHLAEIDSTLAPEERLLVHTMISELSPDDRDAWLDRLV
jgi:hypothetical protein